jgi:acyl-CoA synthetase (AMP-forming)/AMP-acid ligase II
MMTHQSVDYGTASINEYLENTPNDVILSVIPLSFNYGLHQLFTCFRAGAPLLLEKGLTFPYLLLQKLTDERVTGLPLVPAGIALLLQVKDVEPGGFPHLRYVTTSGASLPPAHSIRLQALFPFTRIFSMYGMTENIRGTYLPPEQLSRRPESVGRPIPNTEAYVLDEAGGRAGPGQVGELVIRAPNLMKGYWNDPAATDQALRPGPFPWEKVLYTGDLFRTDEEGFLYFVGRKDDLIKSGGEKVSPKEIEAVLYALDGVKEAAVVGVPHPVLGMAVKAVIVRAEGSLLTAQQVKRHCAHYLEDGRVPHTIEFLPELPKTESGKVLRRALQREAGSPAPEAAVAICP